MNNKTWLLLNLNLKGRVVIMILYDGPCDRDSIPHEVRFFFKLEIRSVKQAEELTKS